MASRSRLPPLYMGFALMGLVMAQLVMRALEINTWEHDAYLWGLAFCTVLGAWVGVVSARVSATTRRRLVVLAAAAAGVFITSVSSAHVLRRFWAGGRFGDATILLAVGAAIGAGAGLLVVVVDHASSAVATEAPAADARERRVLPFVAVTVLVAALLTASRDRTDALIALVTLALGSLSLFEIFLRDRARARFLERVLEGNDPEHEVMALSATRSDVPLAVGGVVPAALVLRRQGAAGYRDAAREPVLQTSLFLALAIAPLRKRAQRIALIHSVAFAVMVFDLVLPAPPAPRIEWSKAPPAPRIEWSKAPML